jgi:hypothetical protein
MLLKQGHVAPRWNYSLQGLCGRSHELADRCEISISQIEMDLITDKTFIEPDNMSNTRSILLETGTAYLRENYCLTQILF